VACDPIRGHVDRLLPLAGVAVIITDRTRACKAVFDAIHPGRGYRVLPYGNVRKNVIHVTSLKLKGSDNPDPIPDERLTGPELTRIFATQWKFPPDGLGTGGRCPYHGIVLADGTAEQCLPLTVRGTHARSPWNDESWAWAVVCEGHLPTDAQYQKLVEIVAATSIANGGLSIFGHSDLPGAANPSKTCPYPWVDPAWVASDAAKLVPEGWESWQQDTVRGYIQAAGFAM
jgi:hypothetical protein